MMKRFEIQLSINGSNPEAVTIVNGVDLPLVPQEINIENDIFSNQILPTLAFKLASGGTVIIYRELNDIKFSINRNNPEILNENVKGNFEIVLRPYSEDMPQGHISGIEMYSLDGQSAILTTKYI